MSHILLITSSPRGTEGLSTRFAQDLARRLASQHPGNSLSVRDLAADPLKHIDEDYIVGRGIAAQDRSPAQAKAVALAEELVAELQAADVVVIGSAMINFGPPTQLKAWLDYVTWPGVTFQYADGAVQGLVKGKKVYLVTASGGVFSEGPYAPLDFQSGYLKHMLGFMGMNELQHLPVEGTAYGPEALEAAIAKAGAAVQSLLAEAA